MCLQAAEKEGRKALFPCGSPFSGRGPGDFFGREAEIRADMLYFAQGHERKDAGRGPSLKRENMDKEELKTELLKKLRREMNGVVASALKPLTGDRLRTYGVSLPVIRRLAAGYAPDPELARVLFASDVRELKIAALYLEDPARTAPERWEEWRRGLVNREIGDLLAAVLLGKRADTVGRVSGWLDDPDPAVVRTALMAAGRSLSVLPEVTEEVFRECMEFVGRVSGHPDRGVQDGAVYLLVRLCRAAPGRSEAVRRAVSGLAARGGAAESYIAGEAAWQIE